jgi:hypothetical protein
MPPRAQKKVTVAVELKNPQPKKSVVRFDSTEEGAAITNAYISNEAVEKLGNPSAIRITIEAL